MKSKDNELDVDFIGGQGPLTETEEKALSEYFKKKKSLHPVKSQRTILSNKKKQPV